jgi:hypothetical protein
MRVSPDLAGRLVLAVTILGCLFLIVVMAATDPDFHPKHIRGRGAIVVVLLLLMTLALRAAFLWSMGALMALGILIRAVRISDRRTDYILGRQGVTNVGLLYTRHVRWDDIERVVFDRNVVRQPLWTRKVGQTFAQFQPKHGARVAITEAFRGASCLHPFGRGRISIPLTLTNLDTSQMARIIAQFRPGLPIVDNTREAYSLLK